MLRLAVFARAPASGRVKSRLSPALPERLAAALYAGLLTDTLAATARARADERFAYWADGAGPAPAGIVSRAQRGADLGERLVHAFAEMLPAEAGGALVVASDTPGLTKELLDAALAALERHELVLGPAHDGGYWCIGLRRPAPELFSGVAWGSPAVLAATLARASAAGLHAAMQPPLGDLDTPPDVAELVGALARGEPGCGGATRAALHAMGMLPAAAQLP